MSACEESESEVQALKKKKHRRAERNCTFPRQRESRTLVPSEGPPEKPEQRETHASFLRTHITEKTNKYFVFQYEKYISWASPEWVISG